MKASNLFSRILVIALASALFAGCAKESDAEKKAEAAGAEKKMEPQRLKHNDKGETVISLDEEMQKRIGLKIEPLQSANVSPELKAYGRVLDTAPLVDLLMELGRAKIAFDNSHRELERMKILRAQTNASERVFQTAEAAYKQDFAAAMALRTKIQMQWGERISELMGPIVTPVGTQSEPPRELDRLQNGLVRVDLPAGESLPENSGTARLVSLAEKAKPVMGDFFDALPTVDPQTQLRGLLFLAKENSLKPGEAVTAYLQISGETQAGAIVPRSAVIRYEGAAWAYMQTDGTNFTRRLISLERPMENGWLVTTGVTAGENVVTTGAQTVFSDELGASGTGESGD
jgi:hypothetical protein